MTAYYNEFDKKAAAWLRELIADGHIAPGDVDERSILEVTPNDLRGYTQCHFFAGIGGWSLALRLAGWPDDRSAWTGSCPCQPFSEAGGRSGFADERHLWPAWHWLIAQRRPRVVFGEQVEAAIRYGWLDLVHDDLEAIGYTFAAAGLPAACVGAPHIRQRLWFVADTGGQRQQQQHAQFDGEPNGGQQASRRDDLGGRGGSGQLGVAHVDAERTRLAQRLGLPGVPGWALGTGARQAAVGAGVYAGALSVADAQRGDSRREAEPADHLGPQADGSADRTSGRGGAPDALGVEHAEGNGRIERRAEPSGRGVASGCGEGFWSDALWIDCRDGKRRPVESGIFPLAHGVSGRVGLLRGSGNAIVPEVAAAFIQEYIATRRVI